MKEQQMTCWATKKGAPKMGDLGVEDGALEGLLQEIAVPGPTTDQLEALITGDTERLKQGLDTFHAQSGPTVGFKVDKNDTARWVFARLVYRYVLMRNALDELLRQIEGVERGWGLRPSKRAALRDMVRADAADDRGLDEFLLDDIMQDLAEPGPPLKAFAAYSTEYINDLALNPADPVVDFGVELDADDDAGRALERITRRYVIMRDLLSKIHAVSTATLSEVVAPDDEPYDDGEKLQFIALSEWQRDALMDMIEEFMACQEGN